MSKIIVFSPNRYSLYTTTVTGMLIQRGVQVSAIYVRRLINPARAIQEFRRDGGRLLAKVWKKLFLRQAAYRPENYETILDLRRRNNITVSDIEDFKKLHSIPVHYCATLNDPAVVDGLRQFNPDLVVFTGGGLIRQEVLDNSGHGVVNCHMGVLPQYRGMDVVEWPILEGHFDQVGITVHFMDKGVDTGDILYVRQILLQPSETIKDLRNRMEPIMCRALVDTCDNFLKGELGRQPQAIKAGKQYYKMHPRLQELCSSRLIAFQTKSKEEHV
jgi:methionyl-tRNA formyltransferase